MASTITFDIHEALLQFQEGEQSFEHELLISDIDPSEVDEALNGTA
jgi:hypothetical protein